MVLLLVHVSTAVRSFAQAWDLAIFRLIRVKQVVIPAQRKREGPEDFMLMNEIVKLVYVRKRQVEKNALRQFFSSRHVSLGNENDLAPVITDGHDSCIAVRHTLQGRRKSSVILVGCSIWQEGSNISMKVYRVIN